MKKRPSFLPPRFETKAKAIREDRLRIRHMKRVIAPLGSWIGQADERWRQRQRIEGVPVPKLRKKAVRQLIDKLSAVLGGDPLSTLASSSSMRRLRMELCKRLHKALASFDNEELRTFTVLNINWVFAPEELDAQWAEKIKNQLRTHLNRIGVFVIPGPFIAFLHGEFEPTSGKFVLHFHGVTTVDKAAALMRLKVPRWGYENTSTGAAPIRRDWVRNRANQFSYLLKSFWPMKRVLNIAGEEKRNRKPLRIPEPWHTQYLRWLDRQALPHLCLMNDCWSPKNGGSEEMRKLYLLLTNSDW